MRRGRRELCYPNELGSFLEWVGWAGQGGGGGDGGKDPVAHLSR